MDLRTEVLAKIDAEIAKMQAQRAKVEAALADDDTEETNQGTSSDEIPLVGVRRPKVSGHDVDQDIIDLVTKAGKAGTRNTEIAEFVAIDGKNLTRRLMALVEAGKIRRVGKARGTRYLAKQ